MKDTDKKVDPLPDEFSSEEEAGKFWDNHSITDYENYLEPAKIDFDIKRSHFEIEIDEDSFRALCEQAKKTNKPIKKIASQILKKNLVPA